MSGVDCQPQTCTIPLQQRLTGLEGCCKGLEEVGHGVRCLWQAPARPGRVRWWRAAETGDGDLDRRRRHLMEVRGIRRPEREGVFVESRRRGRSSMQP